MNITIRNRNTYADDDTFRFVRSVESNLDTDREIVVPQYPFHENQKQIAHNVLAVFKDNPEIACFMIIAIMQSGKTGAAIWLCVLLMNESRASVNNIFIITGLSSIDWMEQTKNRIPGEKLKENVFHRGQLEKFYDKFNQVTGPKYIILDEVQVASGKGMSISKTFEMLKLKTFEDFSDQEVKLIELSATPDGVIFDSLGRNSNHVKVDVMRPGNGYVSWFSEGAKVRVEEAQDLTKGAHQRLTDVFREYDVPKYHIVRVDTRNAQICKDNFIKSCDIDDYATLDYDQDSNKKNNNQKNINTILAKPPEKHTYVFVKEMFRCSKTLIKTHIGIMYERITKARNDSVFSQGLVGRALGYEENNDIVVFTHRGSLDLYKKMYDNKFSLDSIESVGWRSNTTTVVGNKTVSMGTFQEMGIVTKRPRVRVGYEFETKNLYNYEEFHKFCEGIGYEHKMSKNKTADGFYAMRYKGAPPKIYSEEEYDAVINNINVGVGKKNKHRSFVYYVDVANKESNVFVVKYRV